MLSNLGDWGMAAEDGPWLSGPFRAAGINASYPTTPVLAPPRKEFAAG
jgi:hypothetical protein